MLTGRKFVGVSALALISVVSLVLGFQNCGSNTSFNMAGASGSGNGDGYEGKPEPGEYVRVVPGFACGPVKNVFAKLKVSMNGARHVTVDTNSCAEIEREVSLDSIKSRTFSSSYLTMGEGVFERKSDTFDPQTRLESFLETICEVSAPAEAMSVIVREDVATAKSAASILLPSSNEDVGSVSRSLTSTSVVYATAGFSLVLSRAPLPGRTDSFLGVISRRTTS